MRRPATQKKLTQSSRLRHSQRRTGKRGDDLLTVEAAVFYKNFAGMDATDDYAREINPGHIAFQSPRIDGRLIGLRIELHTKLTYKSEIGMIAGERKHLHRTQIFLPAGSYHMHEFRINLRDACLE